MNEPRSLEIDENIKAERRWWIAERTAWTVMALLLAAAIAGAFGSGPLSRTSSFSPDVEVEYDRFGRRKAPCEITLRVRRGGATGNVVSIAISRDYWDRFQIESVVPEPQSVRTGRETVEYDFAVDPGEENVEILFRMRAEQFGSARGLVRLAGSSAAEVRQFFYP